MALSEFGALTREFYIAEIGTWENYGGKRVWRFIGGRFDEVLLYCKFGNFHEGFIFAKLRICIYIYYTYLKYKK